MSILGQLWQDKKDRIKAAAQAARGGSTGHGAKKKTLAVLRKGKEKKIETIQHELNRKLNKLTRRSDELRVEAKTAQEDRASVICSERYQLRSAEEKLKDAADDAFGVVDDE